MLADVETNPAQPPLAKYVWETLPDFFTRTMGSLQVFESDVGPEKIGVERTPAVEGMQALYWTGDDLAVKPVNVRSLWMYDFYAVAIRLIELAKAIRADAPTIIDFGSGPGTQSLALRAISCPFPVVNVDAFAEVLSVGKQIAEGLGLSDIAYIHADVRAHILAGDLQGLKREILAHVNGPVIMVSRKAVHPFYTPDECRRLFDFAINDLRAVAGIHIEMTGHRTAAFNRLALKLPDAANNFVGNKLKVEGDPIADVSARADVKVHERVELWPHFITGQVPSFLSWTKA